jgi:POT family proton-dependent oligopeptide transporter
MATVATAPGGGEGRTFLGHPTGLYTLFFAEMWERFSYYGMRALLIFYLTQHWLFSDGKANLIYGAYASLVYITPVLGGYLADRYLGQRKAVQFGAVLLTFGHCLMAVEGVGGQNDPTINVFWLALAFIIVGSGFLKANISVIVGQLYELRDVRRDSAYTIFYMGVNSGAAIGSIFVGYLGQTYGWSWGFGSAGVGMLLGLIVFVLGRPSLRGKGEAPDPELLRKRTAGMSLEWLLYVIGTASVIVIWVLIQFQAAIGWLLLVAGIALIGYIVAVAVTKLDRDARHRIYAVLFLLACEPIFWGLYEQAGGSLNLFTDRYVDRTLFGWDVPASIFQSVNPIYILLLGPVFAWLWPMLARRGWEPSTPAKFGLGVLQVGFSFLVLVWGAEAAGMGNATPVIFIFLIYLFQTTGELCLSPVGLSAMNRLAPAHMAGLIMGAWFYATAGGEYLAGMIGHATGAEEGEGAHAAKELVLSIYNTIGWIGIGVGIGVLVVAPLIKRLMHLDTLGVDTVDAAMAGQSELAEPEAAGFNTQSETR